MENELIKIELEKKEIELLITALDKLQLSGLQAAQFVLNTAAKLHSTIEEKKPLEGVKMAVKK
jgi:hypothetical protein